MNTLELPFAKVLIRDVSLAEIIADEGVEINSEMVLQLHTLLLSNFSHPIGILENKINEYSYTFRAQIKLGDIPEVGAIAVVAYSQMSKKTTQAFNGLPRKHKLNLQIFDKRKDATEWLETEIKKNQITVLGVV